MTLKQQKCPECGSRKIVKFGRSPVKLEGARYWVQRFMCNKCGRTFRDINVRFRSRGGHG